MEPMFWPNLSCALKSHIKRLNTHLKVANIKQKVFKEQRFTATWSIYFALDTALRT